MLNHIIRFSVRNKLIIGLLMLGLISWGVLSFSKLPIDAVPDITNNQVQVITVSPSLAAPEVERLITFPIEQATASVPGIVEIRSFSRFGLSLVTIVFNDNTDVYWARQQVSERLQQVRSEIPADAGNPSLGPVTTGLGEIFQYAVKPKKGYEGKYSPTELRTIQDWIVRRQLLGTPGVADVSSFGGNLKQYEVAVNSDRLKSMNTTVQDVFTALQQNNQNTGGAYIEKGPTVLYIRSEGLARTLDDIGKIFVRHTSAGVPVFIRDVAEVRIGSAVRYGAMCFNDEGEVAGAVVMMLKGSNSSDVIKNVKEKIGQIRQTLPEGVEIEPFLDRTKMVNHAIGTVEKNLIEGALIVIFILVLFLGNLRAGLIVASVIPLSMLFAVILMNAFGVSGNLMSLGALDFGLIVDGAVIIVEAVMHRLYHSRHFETSNSITQATMNDEVESAAGKMMNSAVFGQIIILIVYLPILALVGIEGKMFKPMAQTVSFALIGAFILSLTYVPMITSLFLSKKMKHGANFSDKMMGWIQRMYEPVLRKAMDFPKLITTTVVLFFVFAVFILTRLGGEFIPKLEEGDFAVDTRLLTGSSLSQTIESTQKTAGILLKRFPEVEKVVTKIGSGEIPTDPMPIEASDMMVILKEKKDWTSAKTFDELADKMSKALEDVPGITAGFQYPVQMRFNELMTGARQDVVCKIFGEDLDTLAAYSKKLGDIVNTVNGAADLYVETVTGLPQIVIHYNRDQMSRFQLNVADVNKVIRTAFAGESAGMIYENERRFDLVLRLGQQSRTDIADVQNLLIATPAGAQIPLYQVAAVEIKEGPNQIQREDARRRIVVGFNVRGRDVQSVVDELSRKVGEKIQLPSGYYITYGGQFENLVEARKRLSIALPIALLLIFIMLYFAFGKLKYGLLIFSAIPLSAIGGVLALWLMGMPFSISAGVGFIALFGVAVLNGIVLITEFSRLKEQGMHDLKFIIMEGTKVRLRPVLMTASVASLGFLPMALSQGAGAEVQRPLATVVIGGLVTATFLTLILLPVLYMWLEREKPRKKRVKAVALLLFFLSLGSLAGAQMPEGKKMKLDEMLKLADQQNISVRALQKETAYWKQLQAAVTDPAKTQIGAEYGKINSTNNDTRFMLSQSFSLPVVYKRQREFYSAGEKTQQALVQLKQQELHREIKLLFWNMADLLSRQQLLLKMDSVFSRMLRAAALRLEAGETNLLEKTTAEAQVQQLKLQLQQLQSDLLIAQQKLQWLLNTEERIWPDLSDKPIRPLVVPDTSILAGHPLVKYREEQVRMAMAQTMLEKNKLVPDLAAGYSNMSIVGYQSPDGITQKYYGPGKRFGTVSISIGIPVFARAARNKVKAGRLIEEAAQLNLQATDQQLKNQLLRLKEELGKQQLQVNYYGRQGLGQSELIISHAVQNYEKGQISYLEWTTLMNQAVAIRLAGLDASQKLNMIHTEIEYLTGK
ncbi:MAG: CusA/CzcA family heavy metal efflux RND transporter [Sphingobacteriales bacterium]|nr:CusA/CzcA family heavy metal efflux RND transporter [Sphingobacteriales bacterium]